MGGFVMPMHDWTRVDSWVYHDFHTGFIVSLCRGINERLPAKYYAMKEQSLNVMIPDVMTLERSDSVDDEPSTTTLDNSYHTSAVLPCVQVIDRVNVNVGFKQKRIVVYRKEDDRVVGIVELVSPGNKSSRVEYRRFVRKIVDAVDGGLHALIIDPFPAILANDRGIHNIIWRQLGGKRRKQQQDQPLTYVSYESDSNSFSHRCFLQPGRVGEPLPEMPLFLKTEQYIVVPLEECYETAMRDVVPKYRKILEGEASSP